MKILIAPDSFKDSLSAAQVAENLEIGILSSFPTAEITKLPLADGGEGTLDAIKSNHELVKIWASDALFRKIESHLLWSKDTSTAWIEMAQTAGLEKIKLEERNPLNTTTFGVGEQISHAVDLGAKNIVLFVGGSATNDAGIGMASALGYIFFDKNGNTLNPIGENLSEIYDYSYHGSLNLSEISFTVATDVTNPFYGKNGAAHVYAKQKGANEQQIEQLDKGLQHLANLIMQKANLNLQEIAGAGAAGGLGGGAVAYLEAQVVSAADKIFEILNFKSKLEKADLLISGEGCIDQQTLNGKLISRLISYLPPNSNTEIILVGGMSKIKLKELKHPNLKSLFQLKKPEMTTEYSMKHAAKLLQEIGLQIGEELRKGNRNMEK